MTTTKYDKDIRYAIKRGENVEISYMKNGKEVTVYGNIMEYDEDGVYIQNTERDYTINVNKITHLSW